mgnify:CR=1 FL=1
MLILRQLKNQIKFFNLEDKISIINNFESSDPKSCVLENMRACDSFLLTSIKKSGHEDGTPVVLMEAQSCGKPCVVTSNYGIPEVVLDKKTGLSKNSVIAALQMQFDETIKAEIDEQFEQINTNSFFYIFVNPRKESGTRLTFCSLNH